MIHGINSLPLHYQSVTTNLLIPVDSVEYQAEQHCLQHKPQDHAPPKSLHVQNNRRLWTPRSNLLKPLHTDATTTYHSSQISRVPKNVSQRQTNYVKTTQVDVCYESLPTTSYGHPCKLTNFRWIKMPTNLLQHSGIWIKMIKHTWYHLLDAVDQHCDPKKACKASYSPLHSWTVSKNNSKIIPSSEDNNHANNSNKQRLKQCYVDRVFGCSWMSEAKFVWNSNTKK